jgi:hypothetical protein
MFAPHLAQRKPFEAKRRGARCAKADCPVVRASNIATHNAERRKSLPNLMELKEIYLERLHD